MKTLRETIQIAQKSGTAIGHFNISNTETFWGVVDAARELKKPVIIGVSEGERDYVGIKQIKALVDSVREEFGLDIFLNADHTYSIERVQEVAEAGFDSVTIDGSKLSFPENIHFTKKCVEAVKAINSQMLTEGELGYIGTSSKLLNEIPKGAQISDADLTTVEDAAPFVTETKVDLFAPAVGNLHGKLKNRPDPALNIPRIKELAQAVFAPLVLHGGSGISDEQFKEAIKAGVVIVHINTELRVVYKEALAESLAELGDEIAPYKLGLKSREAVKASALRYLQLFS
jgi:fructose-bisphosphate aldolase class II